MNGSAIYNPAAFERSKMLDHGGWVGKLPRKILPSDIDAAIDNNGEILIWELSTATARWQDLKRGQLLLIQAFVRAGAGKITAALARVPTIREARYIDTYADILEFSVMSLVGGRLDFNGPLPGDIWPAFIDRWFECTTPRAA